MAAEAGSQKSSDSGKVYDFKDSKTSGVVTVTKSWDDSMSNDERSVPDVSISTAKPSKNPLGYTITYHGNGLTFEDGTTENEIIVNSTGEIVSGSYKIPDGLFAGWYSDKDYTRRIEIDSNGLPVNGLVSDMELYAKSKTFVIKGGKLSEFSNDFNDLIPDTTTSMIFTNEMMPASATLIDVDADGDGGVVAWMDGTVMKVSSQVPGQKVIAPMYSHLMFNSKSNLSSIDFSNLDTSNVVLMTGMFNCCNNLTNLDLSTLNTSNVVGMDSMFAECASLTSLDLTPLDTSNVTTMSMMFYNCNGLTSLNLSSLDTSKVTNMSGIFSGCSKLTNIDLTPLDTSKVTDMSDIFRGCSKLTNIDLTPLNTSNVRNMSMMFSDCSRLTVLDLTPLDTQKVTNMNGMFFNCSKLTALSLGDKFAFIGSNYRLPSGTWYASDGTAYTSNGTTCTIPNNKSDTYTRQ